ncbi:hypothetical protein M2171_005418 [Bradyrhizobium japonicum USDA 38]|nr:hypothetical protein [Bradyrhizobium japonicum USDA 38]MCS3948799.1 hypothetical protein [Bradyrhizobium japonicum]MCW2218500.1 hypothetical protein [Bradyrhizobium japonicum]MCW2343114.1 hypothetical protein [Bradyrhizobium japonicum]
MPLYRPTIVSSLAMSNRRALNERTNGSSADPTVLLRNYAKRKRAKQTDEALNSTLSAFATGFLGS